MDFGKQFKKNLKKNYILILLLALVIFMCIYLFIALMRSAYFKPNLETLKNIENLENNGSSSKQLVYYYMDGCGHCKTFTPIWESFVRNYTGTLTLKKIESKDIPAADTEKYDIQGFPTVLAIDANGRKTEFNGDRTEAGLKKFSDDNE